MKQSGALQRRGRDRIALVRVKELEGGESVALLFHFYRAGDPISLANKEATFLTQIGPLQFKAKFALTDMHYRGRNCL